MADVMQIHSTEVQNCTMWELSNVWHLLYTRNTLSYKLDVPSVVIVTWGWTKLLLGVSSDKPDI
jgi:hypothetical protein